MFQNSREPQEQEDRGRGGALNNKFNCEVVHHPVGPSDRPVTEYWPMTVSSRSIGASLAEDRINILKPKATQDTGKCILQPLKHSVIQTQLPYAPSLDTGQKQFSISNN